jgi:hypothetical protein
MLFERRDKSRGIFVPLPFEAHVSPAMKYLAHWIYSNDRLQTGVTEENLVSHATEYLCPRRFEDKVEAERAARDFIDFCRGRAWVFTDTGTTKTGERLYQFTHRTFLEYFTAAHLVRTNPTPDRLLSVLLDRIGRREWDVVSQLSFQLQNKQVEGAGDALLDALLDCVKVAGTNESWNMLSFAARSLEFLVPSPRVTKAISFQCTESLFGYLKTSDEALLKGSAPEADATEQPFAQLLSSSEENIGPISDTIEKEISRRIPGDSELWR